ncbi:c-type cytochrome [Sodalis ligni]|jgi:cytochrome c553|uniref:Cytochrome c553 n=1 Tax=Sodalis ligni TaxID=2697027 RepID=A0A4R1NJB5_9GAMM|nr:c-type cytochrome [Sodalis ligni]QWA09445.1 c-type cytochrome [Sodalis ligni]TCL07227.1 cytochrome c553 [Sodalis ligni]
MKKIITVALLCCAAAPAFSAVDGALKYSQSCADCHGRKADRQAFGKAPPLISLSRDQLVSGLTDRRDGKIETSGAEHQAKTTLTDEDIQGLADYIQTLKH